MMIGRVEVVLTLMAGCALQARSSVPDVVPRQPTATVRTFTTALHGISVIDPYRWMEDRESGEFHAWTRGQDSYARAILERRTRRGEILRRLTALSADNEEVDDLRVRGGKLFYLKRPASDSVFKLYVRDGVAGRERVLIDPRDAGQDTSASIDFYEPSPDGRRVALGVSSHGSEDSVLHVLDIESGKRLADPIDRARHGEPRWMPDGSAFFYRRNPTVPEGSAASAKYARSRDYLHVIGEGVETDQAVFGFEVSPDVTLAPRDSPYIYLWAGCPYVFGVVQHGTSNDLSIYLAPLARVAGARTPWKQLAGVDDQILDFAVHGGEVFLLSHRDAPRAKVIRTRLDAPDLARAATIVAASDVVVSELAAGSDALYVRTLEDGIGHINRVPFDATPPKRVPLPLDGTISDFAASPTAPGCSFQLESWVLPGAHHAYVPSEGRVVDLQIVRRGQPSVALDAIETKVTSADGTRVPLSIVYRRGLDRARTHPTILAGYGSYGLSMSPRFDPRLAAWFERDGIYAVAHVRGGGEYGEEWHAAGMKHNKQRSVDDFIAGARFLIENGYTTARTLAASGVSAGGITVGSALTQRPELFGAVLLRVAITDALRFETTPLGPQNAQEFGSSAVPAELASLYTMSPYYHVRDGAQYPAVLLTAGAHDARVPAWQPGKLAARLQAATASRRPILFRLDSESGHGYGLGTTSSRLDEELADCYAFLFWQLVDAPAHH